MLQCKMHKPITRSKRIAELDCNLLIDESDNLVLLTIIYTGVDGTFGHCSSSHRYGPISPTLIPCGK